MRDPPLQPLLAISDMQSRIVDLVNSSMQGSRYVACFRVDLMARYAPGMRLPQQFGAQFRSNLAGRPPIPCQFCCMFLVFLVVYTYLVVTFSFTVGANYYKD